MKTKVYLISTKSNNEKDLIEAVKVCFDQFRGVENIVKDNIFIKINATAINVDAITTPEVIIAIIEVIQHADVEYDKIFVFDNDWSSRWQK